MDAQHFAAGAYIILLIALVFFIGLSAVLIFALNRKLKSTLGREGKGAAYSRAVLLAQEDERARISRDLHDIIAQDLRGLSLQLTAIGKAVGEKEREELRAASASCSPSSTGCASPATTSSPRTSAFWEYRMR